MQVLVHSGRWDVASLAVESVSKVVHRCGFYFVVRRIASLEHTVDRSAL